MRWWRSLAGSILALAAVVPAADAARGRPISSANVAANAKYGPRAILCAVDTRRFRVWWDERRGSPDAPPGVDGSCATVPPLVESARAVAERTRARTVALGFPAPPSDAGTGGDGGDARHDIYVHRTTSSGETGSEWCAYVTVGGKLGRRWSYTVVGSRFPRGANQDQLVRETLAHEYFHAIQCGIAPKLSTLPPWIVEGTANWVAALVVDGSFEATGARLGNLMTRLLQAAGSSRPLPKQAYEAWGFWYSLTGGATDARRVRNLLRALARKRHSRDGVAEVVAAFPGLAAAFRDYAAAIRGGGSLGGATLPGVYADQVLPPVGRALDLTTAETTDDTAGLTLGRLGYGYRAIRWSPGTGSVSVSVEADGRLGDGVALVFADHSVQLPTAQAGGALTFTIPQGTGGEAVLVMTNAGPTVAVTASATLEP